MCDTAPLEFRASTRLDPACVRAAWQRAAPGMATQSGLLMQAGKQLIERLEDIRLTPEHVLDLGDRTGQIARQLQVRWPKARIVALTFAERLAQQAGYRALPWQRRPWNMVGDATCLPFDRAQFDLVISNMALHWTGNLSAALREMRRVLAPDRLLLFTVAGADTLWELHACLAQLDQERDGRVWVRGPELPSLQALGDLLLSSGFVLPVVDCDRVSLPFPDLPWLLRQIKAMGAGHPLRVRPHGLRGKAYFKRLEHIYVTRFRQPDQSLSFTLALLFGHAWKAPVKEPHDKIQGAQGVKKRAC